LFSSHLLKLCAILINGIEYMRVYIFENAQNRISKIKTT